MERLDELVERIKLQEDSKAQRKILWVLAVIGAVAAVVGIAVAVYKFLTPDYLEDFDDEFDDDYDDFFEDDAEEKEKTE